MRALPRGLGARPEHVTEQGPVGLPLIFQHPFDSFELHLPAHIEAMCLQERTETFSRCSCQLWRRSYFYPI